MFKRRTKLSYAQRVSEGIYPRGGWTRAFSYVMHRLRRLPDPPHKVARGIAAGIFVCFTPFFGFHFVLAIGLGFVMQGNILAALLATFFGNPLTIPIIATVSIELGSWMLGMNHGLPLPQLLHAFTTASVEIWHNVTAIFTVEVAHWDRLGDFFSRVFLPYMVGGIVPGVIAAVIGYMLTLPAISAYQKARIKRLKKRYEKKRAAEEAKADAALKAR